MFTVLVKFDIVRADAFVILFCGYEPGRVAQLVGHLTRKLGILGSIPGLATYFRFSFRFFKKLSVTGESMCTKYWLTA